MPSKTECLLPTIIAPSILSSDFANLAHDAKKVLAHGVDWLHVDIMDGHFVNNITIGPCVVKSLSKALPPTTFFDCHLMVADPERWIEPFATAGASQFTFHIEACKDIEHAIRICNKIRQHSMKSSISVKPKTEINTIEPLITQNLLDNVLIMTVEPGFGGQKFMEDMMPKVKLLREKYPSLNIEVDGGLTIETTPIAVAAGANAIVAGNAIFGSEDWGKVIGEMRATLRTHFG